MAAPKVRVMCSSPSVRAARSVARSDSAADAPTEYVEMSLTEEVSRALSAVFTCGPPGTASVRRDISGWAGRHGTYDRLGTWAACHGCTGSSRSSPSRSSPGHSPDTRHSAAGTATVPSSTTGRCSGPYASWSATEKPGRERQLGWKGWPSTTRCSHSQSRSGHSFG